MKITEKVAYLRGLFEGYEINADKKEGRILKEMLEVLEDMALSIADLEEENDALQGVLDAMIEDIYDDDDSYDEEDADAMDIDPDTELFEVVCPSCGEEIFVDEETLEMGDIECPACGEELEFDLSSLDEEPDFEIPEGDFTEAEEDVPEGDNEDVAAVIEFEDEDD